MLNFMKNNAGSITGAKVIAPESFQYLKNMSDPILNDSTALANMDILGAHFYGTSVSNMPYSLFQQKGAGKELWMTEVYVPNSDADSADRFPEALDVAYNMHNGIVEGNFQAYVWWYIRRSYGPMKEDGTMSKRGAMMAQYSRFVRPGYVRVDATKNPNTNVYISAYKGDGKVVIVAINKSNSAVNQKFNVQNGSISKVSQWISDSSRKVAAGTAITAADNSFTAQLPAQSVVTYVCESKDPDPKTDTLGDLNSDGQINAFDFLALKKHLLAVETLKNPKLADLDGNGKVDAFDFLELKKYLLGKITVFPGAAK
jgi:glucuronoarabinoxylan endo-1,4-beta-xylanase